MPQHNHFSVARNSLPGSGIFAKVSLIKGGEGSLGQHDNVAVSQIAIGNTTSSASISGSEEGTSQLVVAVGDNKRLSSSASVLQPLTLQRALPRLLKA